MSLHDLKPRFQDLLRPVADRLAGAGLEPNQVTLAALVLSALAGLLVALFPEAPGPLILTGLVMPVRMALNAVDGMIAREHDRATAGGQLFNEIADVAADMMLVLPLMAVPGFSPFLVALVVILAVLTEVAGLAAVSIGSSRRHDGPMGKSDRAAALGLAAFLTGLGVLPDVLVNLMLALVVGLAFLTLVNRVNGALAERAGRQTQPIATKSSPPPPD